MSNLIEEADRDKKIVVLKLHDKWGVSKKDLARFYAKFGFVLRKKNRKRKPRYFHRVDMYRMPKQ